MKTLISYVSGSGGDFLVNCCNQAWDVPFARNGSCQPTASIKSKENQFEDNDLQKIIDNMPWHYVGCHSVDRLLRLDLRAFWLVVPDREEFSKWVYRDAATRDAESLLSPYGLMGQLVAACVGKNRPRQAAEIYIEWLEDYNWTLMQTLLVQPHNKINISSLLDQGGIDSIVDQIPELRSHADKCRTYHERWLAKQLPFDDLDWLLQFVADKLQQWLRWHRIY